MNRHHQDNQRRYSNGGKQAAEEQSTQESQQEQISEATANTAPIAARSRGRIILDYLRPAIALTLVLTLILGIGYPLVITGLAQVLFNNQANGSLVTKNGQVIGSMQIGQEWTDPRYFHGRPSATLSNDGSQAQPYNGANSSASNNGPTSKQLQTEVQAQLQALKLDEQCNPAGTPVPVDLVTSSVSGLDPDISVDAAMYQACRVAKERGLSLQAVQQLIENHIHGRMLGVLGEPYVNVLELNLALDEGA